MKQSRDDSGRFESKSDDERKVRSIRATDETWEAFGEAAESRRITRADLLEEIIESGVLDRDEPDDYVDDSAEEMIAQIEEVIESLDSNEEPLIELKNHRDKAPAKRVLKSLIDYLS